MGCCASEKLPPPLWYPFDELTLTGLESMIKSFLIEKDGGEVVYTGSADGKIFCWNLMDRDKKPFRAQWTAHVNSVTCLACHGGLLVSGSDDSTLAIWKCHSITLVHRLGALGAGRDKHDSYVKCVDFNSKGTMVISGSYDETLRLWSVDTGECLRLFKGDIGMVFAVRFLTDDLIISAGLSESMRLWHPEKSECMRTIEETHADSVYGVSVNSDGTLVATMGTPRMVIFGRKQWNVERTIDNIRAIAICFHPWIPHMLAVGVKLGAFDFASDLSVALINVSNGELIHHFEGHKGEITGVQFTPDGRRLISVSHDCTIRVWDTRDFCESDSD